MDKINTGWDDSFITAGKFKESRKKSLSWYGSRFCVFKRANQLGDAGMFISDWD